MNVYCVAHAGTVASHAGRDWNGRIRLGVCWPSRSEAWRALSYVLTWDTRDGAQLFADMNGGTVTPLAEVFDQSVILPITELQPTVPE